METDDLYKLSKNPREYGSKFRRVIPSVPQNPFAAVNATPGPVPKVTGCSNATGPLSLKVSKREKQNWINSRLIARTRTGKLKGAVVLRSHMDLERQSSYWNVA